jgi:hypothetical protein
MAPSHLAQRIAETINDEYMRFHAVPSENSSPHAQYVDLNRQPYGNLYRKLVEEHNAIVTRVDTNITLDPAHGSDNVRIWFSEIEANMEIEVRD